MKEPIFPKNSDRTLNKSAKRESKVKTIGQLVKEQMDKDNSMSLTTFFDSETAKIRVLVDSEVIIRGS